MKKIFSLFLLCTFLFTSQASFAITDYSGLDIKIEPTILNSKLKKEFSGFEYTITNNLKNKINIVNAQILNGQDGNIAYKSVEGDGAIGVTWAIAGPVGLFTLGIGWIAGIIATPIVWIVQNKSNNKAKTECTAYTNIVPVGYVGSGESITVKTLVPIGSKPQLKLNILDEKTKEMNSVIK